LFVTALGNGGRAVHPTKMGAGLRRKMARRASRIKKAEA
jgi:hypothetical protein